MPTLNISNLAKRSHEHNRNKLDVSNPEHLVYDFPPLQITVLGGIRLDGLDRMRTTLKMEVDSRALRHNLDLYNDNQVEKLIRKIAAKLEIGLSVGEAALSNLTSELEKYRLEQLEQQNTKPEKVQLTPAQQKEALNFLSQPNLLDRTSELIAQSGIVGEEANALLMYIIFTSRKTAKPLHIVSLGASGTGKSHLQESIGRLIPEEDKIEITTLSENAFYYFGQQELKHKLILIEDLDGAESALYPIRELQSKKHISKTIVHKTSQGETRTIHLKVEGPVSVAGCTTKEQIYEDNANRSFLIYLDESEAQDERIMKYQRKLSSGNIDKDQELKAAELLRNTQRLLEPVAVRNPYAELLVIPKEVFKPRRTNNHYLQFIEAVTFYNQKQRDQKVNEATGEMFIETTLEDIATANRLLAPILLRKSDTISGACRNYFEDLKKYLTESEVSQFTNRQVSLALRIPLTTIKRHHRQLVNAGFLSYEKDKARRSFRYEVVSYEEFEQLNERVQSVLDTALDQLNGPVSDQTKNGLSKNQTKKQLTTSA